MSDAATNGALHESAGADAVLDISAARRALFETVTLRKTIATDSRGNGDFSFQMQQGEKQ
jgi:hypothetical protein